MTDKPDDRRAQSDERRITSAETEDSKSGAPIRRTGDDERVRAAIRSELQSDKPHDAQPTAEYRSQAQNKVVQLDRVFLAFEMPILEDVSFEALEGETIVIAGESGTGKSTILKLLLRLLVPDRGEVHIDGGEVGVFDEEMVGELQGKSLAVFGE